MIFFTIFGFFLFISIVATPFGTIFLVNNPYWIPVVVFILIFCTSERLQGKAMKIRIKSLINPKNKLPRDLQSSYRSPHPTPIY